MSTMSLPVPTATPEDLTYRVGWEVRAIDDRQVTVRTRRIVGPDPDDSDGIPVSVEHETSLRGTISTSQVTQQLIAKLSPQDKIAVLMAAYDLSSETLDDQEVAYSDCVDAPILVPDGKVHWLATKRDRFLRWFASMAELEYVEVWAKLYRRKWAPTMRDSVIAWLKQIGELVPKLRKFDDRLDVFMEDL